MTVATSSPAPISPTLDGADETFLLELKPGRDPYHRHGINRTAIYRLKRLLKYAVRDGGFRVNWGAERATIQLSERDVSEEPMTTFSDGPAAGKHLMLKRSPLYLRVTFEPVEQRFDALDQLADTPAPRVLVYVYERVGVAGVAYIDWTENGTRRGGRFPVVSYRFVALSEQPPEDVRRETAKWREWCLARQAAAKAAKGAA